MSPVKVVSLPDYTFAVRDSKYIRIEYIRFKLHEAVKLYTRQTRKYSGFTNNVRGYSVTGGTCRHTDGKAQHPNLQRQTTNQQTAEHKKYIYIFINT